MLPEQNQDGLNQDELLIVPENPPVYYGHQQDDDDDEGEAVLAPPPEYQAVMNGDTIPVIADLLKKDPIFEYLDDGSEATLDINQLPFDEAQARVVIAATNQYAQDFFYFMAEYGVSSTGLFAMFFRAQAYQWHMLLKMGAGALLTPAQLSWAEWYDKTEFGINIALSAPFITSAVSSGVEVTGKTIKYAPAFQKTTSRALRKLRGKQSEKFDTVEFLENKAKQRRDRHDTSEVTKPSAIRKQNQQSIRFTGMMVALLVGGLVTGLAAPFLVGYLLPVVGGTAAVALAAIISAIFIARLSLIVIKHSQRLHNKITSGKAWREIYDMDLTQMNEMAATLGLEHSPWQKLGPKWFRAMHLHWSSGDTNATAGYNSWLPQSALGVIYRKRQSYTLWFQIAGIGLGVLVAFALLGLTASVPIAPWLLIAGAALTGLVLGDKLADGFTHYKGIATTNTSSWLGVAVIVAGIAIFAALGFGWPLAAVAAPAAVVVAILTVKLLYEQVRSKTKNELLDATRIESAISILLRDREAVTNNVQKQAALDYLAVIHKQAYEDYQKNATKLQRLGLLSYVLTEIAKTYIKAWNDINKYVVTDAAFQNKPILRGIINYVLRPPTVLVVGTVRMALATWWAIFPMARLYNYIEACRVEVNAAPNDIVPSFLKRFAYFIGLTPSDTKPNYPPTKFEKVVKGFIGALFVIFNPFYGSSYQLKQAAYQIKKAENKEALRLAEEAYHLIANADDLTFKMEGEHKLQVAINPSEGESYTRKVNGLLERIDELDTTRRNYLEAKRAYIKKFDNATPTQDATQTRTPSPSPAPTLGDEKKPEMQRTASFEKTPAELNEIKSNRRIMRLKYYLGLDNVHTDEVTGKEERLLYKSERFKPSRAVI